VVTRPIGTTGKLIPFAPGAGRRGYALQNHDSLTCVTQTVALQSHSHGTL
jgi:hypothetical protein